MEERQSASCGANSATPVPSSLDMYTLVGNEISGVIDFEGDLTFWTASLYNLSRHGLVDTVVVPRDNFHHTGDVTHKNRLKMRSSPIKDR
jgi:hypothetical protein